MPILGFKLTNHSVISPIKLYRLKMRFKGIVFALIKHLKSQRPRLLNGVSLRILVKDEFKMKINIFLVTQIKLSCRLDSLTEA